MSSRPRAGPVGIASVGSRAFGSRPSVGRYHRPYAPGRARAGTGHAIAAYLGSEDTFDHAVATFAASYADQNERDDEALKAAVESGRLEAQTGV